jgi:hypothetical protein
VVELIEFKVYGSKARGNNEEENLVITDRETLLRYRIQEAAETLADAEAMKKGGLSLLPSE